MPETAQLTLKKFRKQYGENRKPYFEFWNGAAIQKAVPTKLHSILQSLLLYILNEGGFFAYPELTLRIDPNWEPIPDVAAVIKKFKGPYPTEPVDVIVEILSPQDSFSYVFSKCRRYAQEGISDIFVFDPLEQQAWIWEHKTHGLLELTQPNYQLNAKNFNLDLVNLWKRFSVMTSEE